MREAGGGVQQAVLCACRVRRQQEELVKCVPPRFRGAELGHFPDKLYAALLVWMEQPTDGLFISGPVGSGKSHLAAAILLAWRRAHKRGIWRSAAELYGLIRESYALKIEQSERQILAEHAETRLLVLDDLGASGLSDHERRVTLEVLDRRMNELRPTVVTSNWNVTQLRERMDDRIGSRVSAYTSVTLKGADRRMEKP